MIFRYLELLGDEPALFLTLTGAMLFALLIGVGFHEACHAFMADALGDSTPARQGRTTLNPIAHLDPVGTAMMLFIGFGWGKPVQFDPRGLRVSPRTAMMLVAAAGPISNFVAAFLLGLPLQFGWLTLPASERDLFADPVASSDSYLAIFLNSAVWFSVILGVFNLIPIHPLDGFKVALGLLPDDLAYEFSKLAQYGPGILLVLLGLPFFFGLNPLGEFIVPVVEDLATAFTGVG
ncbi:MAG TPA: site-2 protease family protein [Dehalococcoidia bacterium]|nr:site-2 protease family protein [Dehalococcoidia bacterium]